MQEPAAPPDPPAAQQPQPVVHTPPPESPPAAIWPAEEFPERVLLLAPGGPIVLDLWLTVDGGPQHHLVDELLDEALQLSDTNGDGRSTWREWRASEPFFERFAPGQQANRKRLDQWEDLYDRNRNRRIDRSEMASWLGRDWGRSFEALSLRSSRGGGSPTDSRLWTLLDGDASGGLTAAELKQATDVLWSLDADDDRTLAAAELQPLEDQIVANQQATTRQRRRGFARHAALHFGSFFDWGRLSYLLADIYSPRHSLSPESFADLPQLFAELDGPDGDGWLGESDFARLADVEPHVRAAISFADDAPEAAAIERLELSPRADRLHLLAEPSATRRVLSLGGSRIVISVHDLAGSAATGRPLGRSQTRLMVHDNLDLLYEFLDSNADGRLGEREVQSAATRLRECDTNGDGLLIASELPYTLLVAIQRGEDPAAQNFYVPAAQSSTATEGPDWFVAADFNADGDLSLREFLGSPEIFEQLDTSGDGFVDAAEAAAADGS